MESSEEVYQKYAKTVYRYLMSLSHDRDLSEELTQETFYQAIRSIDHYDQSCKMSTWLCSIAKNQYRDYLRKHPAMEEFREDIPSIAPAPSAEKECLDTLSHMELLKALHALPDPYREILYLRLFAGLSYREIGEVEGTSENWARVNFYRGKEKLKKEWNKNEK